MADSKTADLVRDLGEQTSRLVRDEIWLAKREVAEKARQAGAGGGMIGGAALLALYGAAAVVAAVIAALALAMPVWGAALIVGVVLLAVAAVLALLGRNRVRTASPPVPADTIARVREDIDIVKESFRGARDER